MATDQISIYDRGKQQSIPLLPQAQPCLDSGNAPWKGLKLQQYQVGDSERPEATTNSYLAALCLSGSYESEYLPSSGRKAFNVSSRPTHVALLGPGELPARRSKGKIDFLVMEVAPKYLLWAADELASDTPFELQPMWSDQEEQIRYLMMTLQHELMAGCPSGQLFAEYMGLSFATTLLTRHAAEPVRPTSYRGGLSHYKLRQVLAFINDNLSGSLSLVEMANLVQMGPCHFARAFKVSTGASPHQYVLRRRIERALHMLKQAPVNLADLALDLGFSSQGHFTTVFRKVVGVAPHTYREQLLSLKDLEVYAPSDSLA